MTSQVSQYVEALTLDANLLNLVIERNRKQHSRAAYFRRLDMLIRSMKRYRVVEINCRTSGGTGYPTVGELIGMIKESHERIATTVERHKGIHKRRGRKTKVEDEHWSISEIKDEKEQLSPVLVHMKNLHAMVTTHLSEILSRIKFAASALYTELSRGYFPPLCTVALACISRIRELILWLGRDGVLQLKKTITLLEDFLSIVSTGGELEERTGLTKRQVEEFVLQHKMGGDLLHIYVTPDQKIPFTQKGKDDKFKKGVESENGGNCMTDESNNEELSPDDIPVPIQTENDIIGDNFFVETSFSYLPPEVEKLDSGDRNLEMLALVKEKRVNLQGAKKSSKKRRVEAEADEKYTRKTTSKKSKKKSINIRTGIDEKPSSAVKTKKKSKKKKKSKDIIDDIFDGF